MLFPDSIEDPREIFVLLLTYFLDWFPYSSVENGSNSRSNSTSSRLEDGNLKRRENNQEIKHLEMLDQISFSLPTEFGNLCDEIISFFRILLREANPRSEKAIEMITKYYRSFPRRTQFSLFSYIFAFDLVEESPSFSILLTLVEKDEINLPDRFGRYITDRLPYISPSQWRLLLEKDYNLTNPEHKVEALGRFAQNLITASEKNIPIDFSSDLLRSAALSWSVREQRPGENFSFHFHFNPHLWPLKIINEELSLIYPAVDMIEIRKKRLRQEYDQKTQCHQQCSNEIEQLTSHSSWEDIIKIANQIGMIELPADRKDAIRFISERVINFILDMDRDTTWNTIISLARTFEIKQLSTSKTLAFTELIRNVFIYILRLPDQIQWPAILQLANESGVIELSTKKNEVLEEIKTFLSTQNGKGQLSFS